VTENNRDPDIQTLGGEGPLGERGREDMVIPLIPRDIVTLDEFQQFFQPEDEVVKRRHFHCSNPLSRVSVEGCKILRRRWFM